MDTMTNCYVAYHLVGYIKIREEKCLPSELSTKGTANNANVALKGKTSISAKYLIATIVISAASEWFTLVFFTYSSFLPDDDESSKLKLMINYTCLTMVNFHSIWICLQFKIIQNMTFKAKPELPATKLIKQSMPKPNVNP